MSARRFLMQGIKSRRKRYAACDDVVRVTGLESGPAALRDGRAVRHMAPLAPGCAGTARGCQQEAAGFAAKDKKTDRQRAICLFMVRVTGLEPAAS